MLRPSGALRADARLVGRGGVSGTGLRAAALALAAWALAPGAAAQGATGPGPGPGTVGGGGDVPWLFITVAFGAVSCACYAWGRLAERLAHRRRADAALQRAPAQAEAMVGRGPPQGSVHPADGVDEGASAATAAAATAQGHDAAPTLSPGQSPGQSPSPPEPAWLGHQAWLEALPGAALLAARRPSGAVVAALNAAAREHWPQAHAGMPVDALAGLATAGGAALEGAQAGEAITFDGWRFATLALGAAGELSDRPGSHLCSDPGGAAAPDSAGRAAGEPGGWLLVLQAPWAAEGDVFGSTLSHDLRAPIRVVEGFTRIVKEDYGELLDRVGNDHLDRVLGAASRMNLMIDALLTMARLSAQPLAQQPVDLSQMAQFVLDDLQRSGPAREVEVDIEPGLRASGDPTLLRLVLDNLLGNAWKYTARADRARITLHAAQHDGRRAYVVADNGAGFDMRSADRLFGLFQRLHSASDFPGHGVGLASVRRIVRRHGGDIWAEGRPGQGATFTFTLG